MKDTFELRIEKDGSIEGIYQDGLAQAIGAEETQVCRASNVEWEKVDDKLFGWTVRSAKNKDLAIRAKGDGGYHVSIQGPLVYYPTREMALADEVKFFWQLLRKCTQENPCFANECPSCKGGPGGT